MADSQQKLNELWKRVEDASLPELSSTPQASTTVIEFGEEDLLKVASPDNNATFDQESLAALRARTAFCDKQPWWNCTEGQTAQTCRFLSGRCVPTPGKVDSESYYTKWRRVFEPIYGSMPPLDIDLTTGKLKQREPRMIPRRRRSVTRTRVL